MKPVETFPLSIRIESAFVSYVAYIGKTVWPGGLSFFYPYQWQRNSLEVLGAVFFFLAATFIAVRMAKRFRFLAVGWLWYLGTLVPVIGFVQVGEQAMADRYMYIPLIGLFIMAAWGIPELLGKWRHRKETLAALSAAVLSAYFVLTWMQVGYWQDDFTLCGHALSVTENNGPAHYIRGDAFAALGNQREALEDYNQALAIHPNLAAVRYRRGNAYQALGNYGEAIEDYTRAIEKSPTYAWAYNNRGNAYEALGNHEQAIMDYTRAVAADPTLALAYVNIGNIHEKLGDHAQAIEDYGKAIVIKPDFAHAYSNRAKSYHRLGDEKRAEDDVKKAASLGDVAAQNFLRSQGIGW